MNHFEAHLVISLSTRYQSTQGRHLFWGLSDNEVKWWIQLGLNFRQFLFGLSPDELALKKSLFLQVNWSKWILVGKYYSYSNFAHYFDFIALLILRSSSNCCKWFSEWCELLRKYSIQHLHLQERSTNKNTENKIWVRMSITTINLLLFKIQSVLQKPDFRSRYSLKFYTLHSPFCLFLMKYKHAKSWVYLSYAQHIQATHLYILVKKQELTIRTKKWICTW